MYNKERAKYKENKNWYKNTARKVGDVHFRMQMLNSVCLDYKDSRGIKENPYSHLSVREYNKVLEGLLKNRILKKMFRGVEV